MPAATDNAMLVPPSAGVRAFLEKHRIAYSVMGDDQALAFRVGPVRCVCYSPAVAMVTFMCLSVLQVADQRSMESVLTVLNMRNTRVALGGWMVDSDRDVHFAIHLPCEPDEATTLQCLLILSRARAVWPPREATRCAAEAADFGLRLRGQFGRRG